MQLASVRKKLSRWGGRIFTAVGTIVGLAGIGCLAVGLAFTLTGIGAGLGVPLMMGGLIGIGVGVMTASLSILGLWMGKKEDSKPTTKQASSDIPTNDSTIAASSPKETYSNPKLSRVLSFIRAWFTKGTSKVATTPVIAPQPTQKINKQADPTQESSSGSLSAQTKSLDYINMVEALSIFAPEQPGEEYLNVRDRLRLRATDRTLCERFTIEFASRLKALTARKQNKLYCYSVYCSLFLEDVGFKKDESSVVMPMLEYMPDIKAIVARKALVTAGALLADDDLTYVNFLTNKGITKFTDSDIDTIFQDEFCRRYINNTTGFDIEVPFPSNKGITKFTDSDIDTIFQDEFCRRYINNTTGFDIEVPFPFDDFSKDDLGTRLFKDLFGNFRAKTAKEASLFFYYDGIPVGFFIFCCDYDAKYETNAIYLNHNISCEILYKLFSNIKQLKLFDEYSSWRVYVGEFKQFANKTFKFDFAKSTEIKRCDKHNPDPCCHVYMEDLCNLAGISLKEKQVMSVITANFKRIFLGKFGNKIIENIIKTELADLGKKLAEEKSMLRDRNLTPIRVIFEDNIVRCKKDIKSLEKVLEVMERAEKAKSMSMGDKEIENIFPRLEEIEKLKKMIEKPLLLNKTQRKYIHEKVEIYSYAFYELTHNASIADVKFDGIDEKNGFDVTDDGSGKPGTFFYRSGCAPVECLIATAPEHKWFGLSM